jgi:hypothetical protein
MKFPHPPKHFWLCVVFLAGLCCGTFLGPSSGSTDMPQEEDAKSPALEIRGDTGLDLVATVYNSQAKARVLLRLVDGRMTLREAADSFRVLDEANPHFNWSQFRSTHSGNTEEERHCREVMNWLSNHYPVPGSERTSRSLRELTKDLEQQLKQILKDPKATGQHVLRRTSLPTSRPGLGETAGLARDKSVGSTPQGTQAQARLGSSPVSQLNQDGMF